MGNTFTEFIKQRRLESEQTLRQFSQNAGYDVAYISRLENGLITPPSDLDKLKALAKAYSIRYGSDTWDEFSDLAAASRQSVPDDAFANPVVPRFLPVFYRKMRKDKLTEDDIKQLTSLLTGEKTA
jgi:transcriptional regulator with XRE-family HTH domain